MAELSKWVKVSEAARMTGLSVRTIKRMADEQKLQRTKTQGGHVYVLRADLEKLFREDRTAASNVAPMSNSLKNRQERIQGIRLEVVEREAKRDLKKLKEEDSEVTNQRLVENHSRQRVIEEARLRREQDAERRRRDDRRVDFERRWVRWVSASIPIWVSPEQHQTLRGAVKAELSNYSEDDVADEIVSGLESFMTRMILPWAEERQQRAEESQRRVWQERLVQSEVEGAFLFDPSSKARAFSVVRAAVSKLQPTVSEWEVRFAIDEAIRAVQDEKEGN